MRNINKTFILIEAVLAAAVAVLATMMIRENTRGDLGKVSVIVQDSDDNQWTAFKYGLRMAAEDQRIEMFVVGTEGDDDCGGAGENHLSGNRTTVRMRLLCSRWPERIRKRCWPGLRTECRSCLSVPMPLPTEENPASPR